MPIDPFKDNLIPLAKIARSLPKKPSPACLWRWHRKGVNGIKLETVVVGGRRFTTERSWAAFVRGTTSEANLRGADEPTHRSEATERRLAELQLVCPDQKDGQVSDPLHEPCLPRASVSESPTP